MIKKLITTLALSLTLGLGLSLAIAYAQGWPEREASEEEGGGDIRSMGLADPALSGFSVLYMFTGVANDNTPPDNNIATAVHCTNFGTSPTTLGVQFFLSNGTITGFNPYTDTLSPSETGTYSTQNTFYTEVPLSTDVIQQGSGRVLVKEHNQVICTAQLLQPGDITPTFMAKLPMFDSGGNRVGGNNSGGSGGITKVFLPVILK